MSLTSKEQDGALLSLTPGLRKCPSHLIDLYTGSMDGLTSVRFLQSRGMHAHAIGSRKPLLVDYSSVVEDSSADRSW